MYLEIKPIKTFPCKLAVFTINGIKADIEDFGIMVAGASDIANPFGHVCSSFRQSYIYREGAIKKYGITEHEFSSVCAALEDVLYVSNCQWCSEN